MKHVLAIAIECSNKCYKLSRDPAVVESGDANGEAASMIARKLGYDVVIADSELHNLFAAIRPGSEPRYIENEQHV